MKKMIRLMATLLMGVGIAAVLIGKYRNKLVVENRKLSDKHLEMFQVMRLWVVAYQKKKCMETYLSDLGYHTIAIYGMSFIGETLYQELKDSSIKALYGIDRSTETKTYVCKVYHPDERLPEVDAVIVTAVTNFEDVEADLASKVNCPIISIKDILLEM